MGKKLRLDKYLADMKEGSRQEVKKRIKKGEVSVNEQMIKLPEYKVDPDLDRIEVNGREVLYHQFEYWMLYKPAGCVCATEDKKEKTVMEYLPEDSRKDLFPVGRLDKDTEGLLLLTNDGALAHALLSPKKHVDKTYYADIAGVVGEEDREAFLNGLDIGDEKKTLPAKLIICSVSEKEEKSTILVTIQEGRYHQVKRMFEAVGKKVVFLKRLSMGNLKLDETLSPGMARRLTRKELEQLSGTQKE
ncbi:MAG: pseudouridine synthase [Lachnospiraceae bacterium]|nr:pseudouridine synthase [Lachnospiraceae bacterium]